MALIKYDDFYGHEVTVDDSYKYFLDDHLWVKIIEDNIYRFGVTHAGVILVSGFKFLDYAVDVGEQVEVEDSILFVETSKAMINLSTPIEGKLFAINDKLQEEGVKVLEENFYSEFMFAIESKELKEAEVFITADEYLEALKGGDVDHCGSGARVMRRKR